MKKASDTLGILRYYRKKITLEGPDGSPLILYMRAASDLDREDQEMLALAASSRERKVLRDPASTRHVALISPLSDMDPRELRDRVLAQEAIDAWPQVWLEVPDLGEPEPDKAAAGTDADDLEAREAAAIGTGEPSATRASRLEQDRSQRHGELMAAARSRIELQPADATLADATRLTIADRATRAYRRAQRQALLHLCVYNDPACTERAFTFDEVRALPESLADALLGEYDEVGNPSVRFLTSTF